jgi:malonate-semialdehyde dehydrogenase (acetylating)/methylmalonate-semialdehyde dehydrogenase
MNPVSEMGPLITDEHRQRVLGYVEAGVREGADLVVDGRDSLPAGTEQGFFMGACLFDKVGTDMTIYREEIFGPVLSIVRVPDFETALKIVDENPYGNGAAIFTRQGAAARAFAEQAQIGMIGINVPIPVPQAFHSFGGWKNSLFGDHHVHGMEGVRFYTKLKTITSRWLADTGSSIEYTMPTAK